MSNVHATQLHHDPRCNAFNALRQWAHTILVPPLPHRYAIWLCGVSQLHKGWVAKDISLLILVLAQLRGGTRVACGKHALADRAEVPLDLQPSQF